MITFNAILETHGINGVEHGILDHAAHRMQPEVFQQYFASWVNTHQ